MVSFTFAIQRHLIPLAHNHSKCSQDMGKKQGWARDIKARDQDADLLRLRRDVQMSR